MNVIARLRRPAVLLVTVLSLSMVGTVAVAPASASSSIPVCAPNSSSAPPMVTTDKSEYRVGETPRYYVFAPYVNCPITWSSWRNGLSTGETNSYYGHVTNVFGAWSGYGGPWQPEHIGSWAKQATIGGQTGTVFFSVTT